MEKARPYETWRKKEGDRAQDAAHLFGHSLMAYCHAPALEMAADRSHPATKAEMQA